MKESEQMVQSIDVTVMPLAKNKCRIYVCDTVMSIIFVISSLIMFYDIFQSAFFYNQKKIIEQTICFFFLLPIYYYHLIDYFGTIFSKCFSPYLLLYPKWRTPIYAIT